MIFADFENYIYLFLCFFFFFFFYNTVFLQNENVVYI
jgi:hypothetical protein